jgi:hypothetical protein
MWNQPIRLHAESTGDGILLSELASFEEAIRLRDFFQQKGLAPGAAAIPTKNAHLVFLPKISLEEFAKLIQELDVELI